MFVGILIADVLEGTVPVETVSAVLQAMDCHPTSVKTLTQGCLALGNIGRAGECLMGWSCDLVGGHVTCKPFHQCKNHWG